MSQVIYQLEKNSLTFPPPELALTEPNGLLAFDGDLSTQRLIHAYQSGIFPWYSEGEPIMWWSPDPRAVIFTETIKVNKTLKKVLNKQTFSVSINHAFEEVIEFCADAPFRKEGTWIVDDMKNAYLQLHQAGFAHSIEVWHQQELVGGLYGVAINGYFSGESMFYTKSNASKVALVTLANFLKQQGVEIIDCQIQNDFLSSMGCTEITREQFLAKQKQELNKQLDAHYWQPRFLSF